MNAGRPKKQGFFDQVATILLVAGWLIIAPIFLAYWAIESMSTRNTDEVWASWLLVPIALILLFVIRRKVQTIWMRGFILGVCLAFLALPVVTNLVSWNYLSHCVDRVGPQAELRYCDFTGYVFDGQNLSSADFTRAALNDASFQNATLNGAIFTNAALDGADFTGAVLDAAVFDHTNITATLGLAPEILHTLSSWHEIESGETPEETMQIMAAVCQGQGVETAMPYQADAIAAEMVPNILFAIGDSQDYEIQGYLGGINELSAWQKSISVFTQITACFRGDVVWYETCSYTGGQNIPREKRNIAVDLRATLTGEIIESYYFDAEPPPPCPDQIGSNTLSINSTVDFADVRTWLNGFLSTR